MPNKLIMSIFYTL